MALGRGRKISTHRTSTPGKWNAETGRVRIKKSKFPSPKKKPNIPAYGVEQTNDTQDNDQSLALNAYLDTLQAKVFEAKHRLIESGKPVTAKRCNAVGFNNLFNYEKYI